MKILVAGSTGFIGSSLVNHFKDCGVATISLNRRSPAFHDTMNMTLEAFFKLEFDAFLNLDLAGFIYAIGDPQMQGKSSGETALLEKVLEKLESFEFKGKFLLISSNAANPDSGKSTDKYRSKLSNEYIDRKKTLESLVLQSKLNFVILRAPAVVGLEMNSKSHVRRLVYGRLMRTIFMHRIFGGTIEIITIQDLASEVGLALTAPTQTKIIEPIAPCYTWSNLARYLSSEATLNMYKGNGITPFHGKVCQVLPIDLRFLLFPHWVSKNVTGSDQIEQRHIHVIETIEALKTGAGIVQDWHVVTGASSGLGAETKKKLLGKGYNVVGVDVVPDIDSNEGANPERIGSYVFIQGDLGSEEFVRQLKKQLDTFRIAGIFSIAGIGPRAEAVHTSPISLEKIFDVNFFLPVTLYQFLISRSSRRSYFCFIGSSSGIVGLPRFSAYSATKSALVTYFYSVICEDQKNRVDIFGLVPSGMKTNFQQSNGVPSSPLDKYLLTDPAKVASNLIDWMESRNRKTTIQHSGISSSVFLIVRNLPFRIRNLIVRKLSEGSR